MNNKELESIILEEKQLYLGNNRYLISAFCHKRRFIIWKYIKTYRITQYYKDLMDMSKGLPSLISKVKYYYNLRKRNILSEKCGVEICTGSKLGRRLDIWHGGIAIYAVIGDDCVLRGNNIIGLKSKDGHEGTPILGNNIEVGNGAMILGGIQIADNCKIGAKAVVLKDVDKPGSILIGIPAKILEK